ncbi:choline transporter-like 2 [Drosophila biarmipes]|uniref:choline transporter-like 2 n=1 Tax=Drosophila biarmipes TaxID=125945 RepID=UPI0007E74EA1|nr:choline transporter-like 2 [Drosophila biarmipes]
MANSKEFDLGEPLTYDPKFSRPRERNRSCTDVPCLLLFVLFLGGWVFIAQFAYRNGNLSRLVAPIDSFNRECGVDPGVESKRNLFYFDMTKCLDPLKTLEGCQTPRVCLESCPTQIFIYNNMKDLPFKELHSRLICRREEHKAQIRTKEHIKQAIEQNLCASWYPNSVPLHNRCIPNWSNNACDSISTPTSGKGGKELETLIKEYCQLGFTNKLKDKMMQIDTEPSNLVCNTLTPFLNGNQAARRVCKDIVQDVVHSWMPVLLASCCALIASLFYIALMRWFSGQIVWFSIFGLLIGFGMAFTHCILQYVYWKRKGKARSTDFGIESVVKRISRDEYTWLTLSIFFGVCFVVILLIVIVMWKRIRIAIALIRESSRAVSSAMSTLFFPIFSWTLFVAAVAFSIYVGLQLISIKERSFRMVHEAGESKEACVCPALGYKLGESCNPEVFHQHCIIRQSGGDQQSPVPCSLTACSFDDFVLSPWIKGAIFYNFFGFLWLSFFISAFSYMVLASTFARWYWTLKKRDVPFFTLSKAFCQTAFYHLGTAAFGSFIQAVVRMGCLVLEYIQRKLKAHDNRVTRAFVWIMRCFFWLLDAFLKFATRKAYIMCAIHGKNFCTSAKDSFKLVSRNSLRVVTLGFAMDFVFFVSKVLLSAGASVSTYFFLSSYPEIFKIHNSLVPAVLVAIFTFLIAHVFFGVYSTAVDTLFLCFLEDCERNDGSREKPYFMSKRLKKILRRKNH